MHQLVDDIDGTVLEPGEGETVLFSLDGKGYEIDLTEENARRLRETFEKYVSVARRVGSQTASSRPRRRASGGGRDLQAVRAWARENGYTVSDRGRVPEAVLTAYDAAN